MRKLQVKLDERVFEIEIGALPETDANLVARVDGVTVHVRIPSHHVGATPPEWIVIDDRPYEVAFERDLKTVRAQGQVHRVEVRDLETVTQRPVSADGRVLAPIPGVVTQVLVEEGQHVEAGQTLLILEAMKMENQVRAPRSGTVTTLNAGIGRGVALRELLAEVT